MPFDLTKNIFVFIDLMNCVCKMSINKSVIVFIDDIFNYSKSEKEHEQHLKEVLQVMKE